MTVLCKYGGSLIPEHRAWWTRSRVSAYLIKSSQLSFLQKHRNSLIPKMHQCSTDSPPPQRCADCFNGLLLSFLPCDGWHQGSKVTLYSCYGEMKTWNFKSVSVNQGHDPHECGPHSLRLVLPVTTEAPKDGTCFLVPTDAHCSLYACLELQATTPALKTSCST